ncbi:hypothetical protein J6590_078634 [Homalodisca vitripennis]|nr:hypothetical protein J6590_078634 [Homalodisca vitripennis]
MTPQGRIRLWRHNLKLSQGSAFRAFVTSQPEVVPGGLHVTSQPEVIREQNFLVTSQPEVVPGQCLHVTPQPEVVPGQRLHVTSQPEVVQK